MGAPHLWLGFYIHSLIEPLQQCYEADSIIIPVVQRTRVREARKLPKVTQHWGTGNDTQPSSDHCSTLPPHCLSLSLPESPSPIPSWRVWVLSPLGIYAGPWEPHLGCPDDLHAPYPCCPRPANPARGSREIPILSSILICAL